jgi:hypothetical protein
VRAIFLFAAAFSFLACDPAKGPTNADPCNPTPPARCKEDHDCFPFLCKTSFCEKACVTSATCAQGFVCAADGKCVKPGTCGTCSGDYDCKLGMKCDLQTSSCK